MTGTAPAGADPDDDALLAVEEVSRRYRRAGAGTVTALDGVSLRVAAGRTVGLVGPSGAGKSTLARVVAGLEPADGGRVILDGHRLDRMGSRERRRLRARMHLIFQDPYAALAPQLTVGDLVAEPLRIHRRDDRGQWRRWVRDALDEVRLTPVDHYLDRRPDGLSGGERQRVALARALILRPDLVIADEPTAMLDAALRADLLELLADLQAAHGMALVYITHDLALASRICDRLVVMDGGRIVERGPTDRVLREPAHACTRRLVTAVHRLQAALGAGQDPSGS